MKGEAQKPMQGVAVDMGSGIRRILAPNPGPMTHWGTNTYLVGTDPVAIVDPGPNLDDHLAAIQMALGSARVTGVLVTHAHRDHCDLARRLSRICRAPVMGFGAFDAGRSAVMARFAASHDLGGGEGVDHDFAPDIKLSEGSIVSVGASEMIARHTPGHFSGHLSFQLGDVVLTGDVVMGWSTTLISPPDGDVRSFLRSAGRMRALGARRFLPGHGAPVEDTAARLNWLIAHRFERERQILAALGYGPATAGEIAARVYDGLAAPLLPAATRNTLAHLLDLAERHAVASDGTALDRATWRVT